MTSQLNFVQPPRIAAWLVNLFTPAEEAESVLGDLHEEFSHLALKSGVAFARGWYRRQSVKTIAHLVAAAFRAAPWSTSAATAAGFLFMRFVFRSYQPAMTAVLDRYLVYEHHPGAYLFFLGEGSLIGHVVVAMLVGAVIASLSKGREMATTAALCVVSSVLPITATVYLMASGKHLWFWMLPWSLASSLAFLVGGAVIRTRRSAVPSRPSSA